MKINTHKTLLTKFILLTIGSLCIITSCLPVPNARAYETRIVVLWHDLTGTEADAIEALSDQFNAESNASETLLRTVLITEYQQDIVEKLKNTTPDHWPDLVVVWPEDMEAYRQAGLLADHNRNTSPRSLAATVMQTGGDLLPMAEGLFTIDGNLQALPLGLGTYLFYYNVTWMNDLGYNPTASTLETIRSISCAATDPQLGQVGLGMPLRAGTLLALLTAGGAEIFGVDGRYHFADEAGIDTSNVLNLILSGGCAQIYEDTTVGPARLSNSSMAMLIASSLELTEIQQAVADGRNFTLGVGALPGLTGPGSTLWYGPGMLAVAPEGPRREAALETLAWFFSEPAQELWTSTTAYLPTRRSMVLAHLDAEPSPTEEAVLRLMLDVADNGTWVAWPRHTNTIQCRAGLLRALLYMDDETIMPGVHVTQAMEACNTGIKP